jgi:hypothetical protein
VIDVKEELDAPLLFVGQHSLNQLTRLVDDLEISQLLERELLVLNQAFYDHNRMFVQARVVHLVEISDQLE